MSCASRRCILLLLVLIAAPYQAFAQRLPGSVVPEHYDLAFDVDLAAARFRGDTTIKVNIATPTQRVMLHALDLRIEEATITAGGTSQPARATIDVPTQTATLAVARSLPSGPAEIHVKYSAALNDQLRGFYLSKGPARNYAVTQFESTDARRAFPSFDEPAMKATFAVTLTIDEKDNAISNGRLLSDTPGPGPGKHTLKFATTKKMSAYLVAMAVGDFQCLSGEADAIPIRICATPDKRELGHIALEAAGKILSFYNRYYAIKYPFEKLDVVAVPDFAAGAMENTAAIFYREVDLLADDKTASVANQKRIWTVLAHEMAHQWFGDLVTMKWWDDLWLNEGFATWMEKRPLVALKPEWQMEVEEVSDTLGAMSLDSLAASRAIHTTVETPGEIEALFDTITYEKGAAVMRMIEGYVGADLFQRGVNDYLQAHAYGNATSADFWTAVAAAARKPVDKIMPAFVNQQGVPLLSVNATCANGQLSVNVTQQRFLIGAAPAAGASRGSWEVPVCYKVPTESSPTCTTLPAGPSGAFVQGPSRGAGAACAPWVFLNTDAKGYFRSAYTPAMLTAMAPDVQSKLTPSERLSLVGDEWALLRGGRHSIADYLTLTSGFGAERVSEVFSEVAGRLSFVHDYLTSDRTRSDFERFVQTMLAPMRAELGVDAAAGDSDDRKSLRAAMLVTLASAGNDASLAGPAQTALGKALDGGAPLDATAANAIVRVAAMRGDAALWERLMKAAREAASPAEQYRYLYAVTDFQNPALIERSLNFALTPELRSQDTPGYLARLLGNPIARARTWAFVKQHWTELEPKITISLGDVSFARGLSAFCDAAARDDIKTFFAAHKLPAASRTLDQTLETISNCVTLRERQQPVLAQWLTQRK